jgi:UDP-3-O-[3-hydroxymyristoyl] glucosamine N-acyltransferase
VVGRGVSIGEGSIIGSHCTLHKTTVGENVLIHPGVRIGQDGFGFAVQGENILKVPQVGGVIIGDAVEIGANTTIDCGALADTIIEDLVKIDNQVQIGHNVRIGRGTRIVAQSGIAGSASLGAYTVIGGQSGVVGHIALADKVMVAARSGVTKTISTVGAVVAGMPAEPISTWRRKVAVLSRLVRQSSGKGKPAAPEADDDASDL